MRRYAIRDDQWKRIEPLLPGKTEDPGQTAGDNRLFIDAVLWIGRTGAPWRDLPERYGKWNSVFQRFNRWTKKGVWERVFEALQDPDLEWLMIDTTRLYAPISTPSAKKSDATAEALGRSTCGNSCTSGSSLT